MTASTARSAVRPTTASTSTSTPASTSPSTSAAEAVPATAAPAPTAVLELTGTYELDRESVPDLTELAGTSSRRAPGVDVSESTYFDTPALGLLRAGASLRRRAEGADAGWLLTLPPVDHRAEEVRRPLGRATRTAPKGLAELVAGLARGRRLGPVARVRRSRTRYELVDPAGRIGAAVLVDQVTTQTMGRASTLTTWFEIELHVDPNRPDLLAAVEARMRVAGVRSPSATPEFRRALAARLTADAGDAARPSTVDAPKRAAAVTPVTAYLREQVQAILTYEPHVRRGDDAEAIHKMRVATRRIRATLTTFRRVVDGDTTRPLRDELRWCAGVLGEVRDLDVLRGRLVKQVEALPDDLVVGPVSARITGRLARDRADAQARLLEALTSARYYALLDALDALLENPPLTDLAARPARRALPRQVRRVWRRVDRELQGAEHQPPGDERDEAIHESRKLAKRARYAGELVAPVAGKPARRLAGTMERVQETLGSYQDSVVSLDALRTLGMQAHLAGENAFTYGVLYRDASAGAETSNGQLRAIRRQVDKHRAWLG